VNHFGVAVEYALHVITQLARFAPEKPPSAAALAQFQGVPPAYLAKIMTRLEKAGLVVASEGKGGGYSLGRAPEAISFLDVADAIEGPKKLFECTEVRQRCVLYGGQPPKSVTSNVCAIHAVMLAAEQRMRAQLAATTIADIAVPLAEKTSPQMQAMARQWFADHTASSSRQPARRSNPKRRIAPEGTPK
jgi:Rrf2 family protein